MTYINFNNNRVTLRYLKL